MPIQNVSANLDYAYVMQHVWKNHAGLQSKYNRKSPTMVVLVKIISNFINSEYGYIQTNTTVQISKETSPFPYIVN